MNSTRTTAFRDALERHTATWSEATADGFGDALREVLDRPAVGARLPFDGVSLDGLPVTTDPSPAELDAAATGVTAAAFAVADYGSVVLASGEEGTEQASLFPETHVAVLAESDVVADMEAAFDRLDAAFADDLTSAVLATGPSATADMGSLVYGAHGPTDVHVIVLTDR